jgi:DNA-binding NarL/FixJ family response regulator
MQTGATIRVTIIEDDALTRDGLGLMIDATPGYVCAAKCSSIEEALRLRSDAEPDVFLVDIRLPGTSGSEGVSLLRTRFPSAQIVMLTIFAEEERIFESICNGACGYLLKGTTPARLLEAIGEAHRGGAPMTPEIARKVVELFRQTRARETQHDLTPQELRLLSLLSDGHSYQATATRLHISVNTVRNHVRSIYEKLHVHSKSAAVSEALRRRIIH